MPALTSLDLALRCYRELDDDTGIATVAYDSGTVYRELGRFGEALTLRTLGELYLAEQSLDKAAQYLGAAMTHWDDLNLLLFRARTQRDLVHLHRARGDHAAAGAALTEALDIFHRLRSREYAELLGSAAVN